MKKLLIMLSFLLIFTMLLSPLCYAAGDNYDTLADWDIRIAVPDNTTAVLQGGEYYIYAQDTGAIPYVMLRPYRYDSEEKFIADFTEYMQKQHSDLKVTSQTEKKQIGDKTCYEIDYAYKVSGYDVRDRRIVITVNGLTYMFASKEVASLQKTIGTMLEDVIADCEFLAWEEIPLPGLEDEGTLSAAYLYRQKDGMPKYWLDLTGAMADCMVLHCYFRSGDPTFYESVFYLDLESAEFKDGTVEIRKVTDTYGFDCSNWFKKLTIRLDQDTATMTVERDEKTLAGGSEDNILTGTYKMSPISAGLVYEYHLKNGQLKYWLEQQGEDILLHAMFRSGDPEYYEEVFTFDGDSAEKDGEYTYVVKKVTNAYGEDVSHWFKSLTLTQVQGAYLMNVLRDESTMAGGADDNILTDAYLLDPRTYPIPADDGPYSAEELEEWAQIFYFRHNGFYPPVAEAEGNKDGTYTIHLYEVLDSGGVSHTATSAWYTVDLYGEGTDDITEKPISLCR